jgi:mannosylglucosylglycerate synthase
VRIAIVHYSVPPVVGGVERVIAGQAQALARRGHDVSVIAGNTATAMLGVRCYCAVELCRETTAMALPLESLIADHDVVIVHNLFTMPFNLRVTALLRQLAVEWNQVHWVNWVHDIAAINPHYAHLPWQDADHTMLRYPAPNCTNVAVSQLRCDQYLELLRLPPTACCVVPNGLPVTDLLALTPHIQQLIQTQGLWDRDYLLLHPTRILRRKNIELGLRTVAAMHDMGLDVAYLITGAPDPHGSDSACYAQELRGLVAELDIDHEVLFLGGDQALSDADVRSLYTIADAVFFPSLSEGYGLPILEAGLHMVPVFCSQIAAHRDVGRNVATFFELDDEPADIAQRLTQHPQVTARYVRRLTIAGAMDWDRIIQSHVDPLLGCA